MSLKIGANNNIPKGMTGAWIGNASNVPKKWLNAWIGDENNQPKKFYTAQAEEHTEVFNSTNPSWQVPSGVTKIDIFCVGGAGGICCPSEYSSVYTSASAWRKYVTGNGVDTESASTNVAYNSINCAYGGSGYVSSVFNVPVTAGETLVVTVGDVGTTGTGKVTQDGTVIEQGTNAGRGGTSSVYRGNTPLCTADGGYPASKPTAMTSYPSYPDYVTKGGNGGSGGKSAGCCEYAVDLNTSSVIGGYSKTMKCQNGADGGNATMNATYITLSSGATSAWGTPTSNDLAHGNGATTKAFGEAGGTQYDNFNTHGTVLIRWVA